MFGFLSRKNKPEFTSEYDVVLAPEADLEEMYYKSAVFYYYLLFSKITEILNKVFSSREVKNINNEFNELHENLWDAFQRFRNREDFSDIRAAIPRTFKSLQGDYKYLVDSWMQEKPIYFAELKRIRSLVPQKYPIPNELIIAFQKIDDLLDDLLRDSTRYWITYDEIAGKIILNNKYLLTKINSDINSSFFDYVFKNSGRKITRDELKEELKKKFIELHKDLHKIIHDLGFKGELLEIFFPNRTNTSLYFRKNITEKDLNKITFNEDKLQKEINSLKLIP